MLPFSCLLSVLLMVGIGISRVLAAPSLLAHSTSPSSTPPVTIRADELKDILKNRPDSIKLIDASWRQVHDPIPWQEFRDKYYGNFELLMEMMKNPDFEKEHIKGAQYFSLDVANFPGQYQMASLYPPEIFAHYPFLLGLSREDDIVVYARGSSNGMLFAARVWFLLKVYGAKRVRVLEGGLDHWKAVGGAVATGPADKPKFGAWKPAALDSAFLVTYEELVQEQNPVHFGNLYTINFLDARPAGQFHGFDPLAFDPNGAPGTHLAGTKSNALADILAADGSGLKSADEIRAAMKKDGFVDGKQAMTICNGGVQASLLALALAKAGVPARIFNGSLIEISLRAPQLISEK